MYLRGNSIGTDDDDDGRRRRRHTLNLFSIQADRGFATSRLRSDEDGISTNRIIYSSITLSWCVGNDTSKKGGNAPWATD